MLSIPDAGEATDKVQEILFQEYLEILVAGINGIDCVLSGCAVTAQGSPNMTVAVAKGAVLTNGVLKPVTAGNVTIATADTQPRLDLVVVDSTGAKAARTGTAAAEPKPAARSANDVVLAAVYVPGSDTTISSDQITDMRVARTQGPILIQKDTTAVATNTTAAAVTVLSCVIPSGLLLAGKILRARVGGNFLLNSGSPTLTLTIAYGGTTMFADVSGAATADTDRVPWVVDFQIVAQGNSDQALAGVVGFGLLAAKTAPTTGLGEIGASTTQFSASIGGSAAVDSDAADRTLTVQWTMSVSNVADEVVKEFAIVELM
jgi:hypothetical protein